VTDIKGIARPTIEAIARLNSNPVTTGISHREDGSPSQSIEQRFPAYGGPIKAKKNPLRVSQELG